MMLAADFRLSTEPAAAVTAEVIRSLNGGKRPARAARQSRDEEVATTQAILRRGAA